MTPRAPGLQGMISIIGLIAAGASFASTSAQAQPPPAPPDQTSGAGLYMTRAADCMPCHTRPGGTAFAGGREIVTSFGILSSPNITPDLDTGIGRWTDKQFFASMHDGIGHTGAYLYPVMPFPSYTKMPRADVLAIKRYLFSLQPVFSPRTPSAMKFPFNIRDTMVAWRLLYFKPGAFRPDPKHSAEWNRGAYLVEGPGHCGACHTPRNLIGGTEESASLAGGVVDEWLAPNISSDRLHGVGDLSVDALVQFLGTGDSPSVGVAFGPMDSVVHDSLHFLTKADLRAIAVYLKATPDRPEAPPKAVATGAELAHGQATYLANCAQCHQQKGQGITGAIPRLADNKVVDAFVPHDMLVVILGGLTGSSGYGAMPGFAAKLDNQAIADVANYARVGLAGYYAPDVTPAMVAHLRTVADTAAARPPPPPPPPEAATPGPSSPGAMHQARGPAGPPS
jgi:mono/diheme cytochrome c family protein